MVQEIGARPNLISQRAARELERMDAEGEKAKLQVQLLQTQKMDSLGRLAGGVAHDMNNVLGAILSLSSAHLTLQPEDSPAYRAFETIAEAATRGGKMVKGLLSFARQHPAEEADLDLNMLLREDIRLLERTTLAKVKLETYLAEDLQWVRGDAGVLTNAFMNLCVNAVDAMPDNGTLTLRTRNAGRDHVEVEVEDTGLGMSPEVLSKATDPFFTTKETGKGTGLGLSMVYTAVEAHRGQMEIRSVVGRGTCVKLRFPAFRRDLQAPGAHAPNPAKPSVEPLKILLVDDDELIRTSTRMLVEVLGHSILATTCGEEAILALQEGFAPDVIILDMNMPGIGGAGTLPLLRAIHPRTPVLLATGRADQDAMNLVERYEFVSLLAKPFGLEELNKHFAGIARN